MSKVFQNKNEKNVGFELLLSGDKQRVSSNKLFTVKLRAVNNDENVSKTYHKISTLAVDLTSCMNSSTYDGQ